MYYLSTGQEKNEKKKSPKLSFGALWFLPGPLCNGTPLTARDAAMHIEEEEKKHDRNFCRKINPRTIYNTLMDVP